VQQLIYTPTSTGLKSRHRRCSLSPFSSSTSKEIRVTIISSLTSDIVLENGDNIAATRGVDRGPDPPCREYRHEPDHRPQSVSLAHLSRRRFLSVAVSSNDHPSLRHRRMLRLGYQPRRDSPVSHSLEATVTSAFIIDFPAVGLPLQPKVKRRVALWTGRFSMICSQHIPVFSSF
jgi:hypothetical protein